MYPPAETPTSPDDHNMVILDGLQKIPTPEQIPKLPRNPLKMSSDTLRKNLDGRTEGELKRTSLKLDSSTKALVDSEDLLLVRNKRFSLNDRDLIMAMSKRKSNTTTDTAAGGTDDPELLSQQRPLDNRPAVTADNGVEQAVTTTSGQRREATKDENENYCDGKEIDNKNGNDRIMDCGDPRNDNGVDRTNNKTSKEVAAEEEVEDGNGNRMSGQNRHSATTCDENEEEDDEPYHRLMTEDEGKESPSGSNSSSCCLSEHKKENRNSIASSTDESVELREKLDNDDELQDEFDEQRELLFGQKRHSRRFVDNAAPVAGTAAEPMDMLSPNEGPLARRYAEIAQFNGKW